jgi:uncharacterized protein YoaH (UPF0181 family)
MLEAVELAVQPVDSAFQPVRIEKVQALATIGVGHAILAVAQALRDGQSSKISSDAFGIPAEGQLSITG